MEAENREKASLTARHFRKDHDLLCDAAERKIPVTSRSWDGKKVFLKNQVLEPPNVEGRLHVSRKERRPDEWDPPVEKYDPMDRAPRTSSTSTRKRLRHDVIDNAEPLIDDVTRREQLRDAMKHYCKRPRGLWAASSVPARPASNAHNWCSLWV
jgi:hypothetical protein